MTVRESTPLPISAYFHLTALRANTKLDCTVSVVEQEPPPSLQSVNTASLWRLVWSNGLQESDFFYPLVFVHVN